MASPTHLQEFGNSIAVLFDDDTKRLAYPTPGGLWIIQGAADPPPVGGLIDWWTAPFGITGNWEAHASYSRGGTDWGVPWNEPLKAPAAGSIVNLPNVDGAGLKTMLVFDSAYPRVLPASPTLMDGTYVENPTAPAVAMMFQHLEGQVAEGHVAQGGVVAYAGDTGQTTGQHLHAHLLATPSVGGDRLDFMKFL